MRRYRIIQSDHANLAELAGLDRHSVAGDKYSTATITNPDGTKDYGFAASYLGDTTDGIHKPEIFFYLHRTAARAIAAGIEPLDADEVEDLAKQILGSLKWRKTEP